MELKEFAEKIEELGLTQLENVKVRVALEGRKIMVVHEGGTRPCAEVLLRWKKKKQTKKK